MVEQARDILALLEGDLLFARVDAVDIGGELLLMELELIEPALYLGHHPLAPQRLAGAIASLMSAAPARQTIEARKG